MEQEIELSRYKQGLLDFHTHSTHSDGADTPKEVVEKARAHGISAIALTDHNVISGLEEFNAYCKEVDIFVYLLEQKFMESYLLTYYHHKTMKLLI